LRRNFWRTGAKARNWTAVTESVRKPPGFVGDLQCLYEIDS
jgi:hypothetical protein